MRRRIPRLIDDKRRNRQLMAFAILVAILVLFLAVLGIVWFIDEQWRGEGLALLHELQTQSLWLENEMDVSRDAEDIASKLDALTEQLASTNYDISSSDIDFTLRTRKAECKEEAKAVAQQCTTSIDQLSDLRQHLSALLSDGSNVMFRLKQVSSKKPLGLDSVRKAYSTRCAELQKFCESKFVLSWDYESKMAGHRGFLDFVLSKRQSDGDWREIEQTHLSFVNWTNQLANTLASYNEKDTYVRERFTALQQFPFDHDNTVKLTRTKMNDEMPRIEPLISSGTDLVSSSLRRVEEEISRYQTSAKEAFESLSDLKKAHGDFVDTSCVTWTSQLVDSFIPLQWAAKKSVEEHITVIQKHLEKVTEIGKIVRQTQAQLDENDTGTDERLAQMCETGLAQVHALSEASTELKASITSLTNYVAKVQADAKDASDKIAEMLKKVKQSLPDCGDKGKGIVDELVGIRRNVIEVKASVDELNKKFVYFRDNYNPGTMDSLRTRLNKTYENLKSLEAECTETFPCSNGVELSALMQRRDKAKKAFDLVKQKVDVLFQDMEQFVANGSLRQIKFVDYTESFAAQLQQGIRHFDFAINIPDSGHHQVAIRFSKGGRSLYKISKKHKIVLQCIVSGVRNTTENLSWEDMTSSWHGSVTLEGNFKAGLNDIALDLSFGVAGLRGKTLPSGQWQYQYDSGLFKSNLQDNFSVEFWVDGIKKNVLIGVPAQ